MVETKKQKIKVTKPVITSIPNFRNTEGKLIKKIKKESFPLTKEGKMAFCDYVIAKWVERKAEIERRGDKSPMTRIQHKRDALMKKLAEVNEALAEMQTTKTN